MKCFCFLSDFDIHIAILFQLSIQTINFLKHLLIKLVVKDIYSSFFSLKSILKKATISFLLIPSCYQVLYFLKLFLKLV